MSCYKNSSGPFSGVLAAVLLALTTAASGMADEGEGRRLTHDGTLKRDPFFARGGDEIVYCVDENRVQIRLRRLDVESGESTPIHPDATRSQFEPALSPDGRYLAFNECTGNLMLKFVIRDLQEKKDAELTCQGRGGMRSPTFSPDGQRVLYSFAEDGPQQIFSVDVNARDRRQLTRGVGIHNWPSYTPDGQTIVFGSSRDRNYEIYSMRADGTGLRRLTRNENTDIRPRVSPDGEQIAFVSLRDGNRDVYVMNLDGSGVQRVTHNAERDDYPDWHPDGRRLVIVSERNGRHDLYLVAVPPVQISS